MVDQLVGRGALSPKATGEEGISSLGPPTGHPAPPHKRNEPLTEDGAASMFVETYGEDLRFDVDRGR